MFGGLSDKCDEGEVEYDGRCMDKKFAAREIIRKHNVNLNAQAQAYLESLDEASDQFGDRGTDTQLKYIASNINPQDKEERLAVQQITAIADGEDVPDNLPDDDNQDMTLGEQEYSDISRGFESYTEPGPGQRAPGERSGRVDVDDFEKYADKTGYPVEKVLAANPWVDSVLTEEAKERVKEARDKVELEF